ncbi:MAG TPA: mobile mystery protein B [Bacteroides sp.]|nr:mobile mystery protein B [Bacteroides sp.]
MGLDLEYIYGQTPISEEEKDGILIKTISTRKELDEFEQHNIESAFEWTISKKFSLDRILTIEFIMEVHKRMFNKTWEWAGKFRNTNKNIGIDKLQISTSLITLLDDCRYWIDNETYSHDEIAIRFKFRLVKIHPFPNGNGRHSRLCADILISNVFNEDVFTWGGLDLVKPGESRKKYIDNIHNAEQMEMKSLIAFARS